MKAYGVLYLQYTNPAGYPPLEHSSRILAQARWQVLFLGTKALGTSDLQFPVHPHIQVRQLPFCPVGALQKIHYLWFLGWAFVWTLWWRPGWIYASDPLSCPAALLLSFIPGLKILYHEHDSPNPPGRGRPPTSISMRFTFWMRRKLAQRARLCILPNQERSERFSEETGRRKEVFAVWNCPSREEVTPAQTAPDREDLWLLYQGSLSSERLPLTLLEALTLLPPRVKFKIIGYETVGYRGYLSELKKRTDRLGVGHRIQILGALPRRDLFSCARGCDVGFSVVSKSSLDVNLRLMVGASNKSFDYLACGLALLVSDLPDWRKTFVEPGYGLACSPEDPRSIADGLRWFLDHPVETWAMGQRGRQRVLEEWNYEKQFAPVLKRLKADISYVPA